MSELPGAYGDAGYAAALSHVGQPVELTRAGGWMVARDFADGSDLMAPYPLLCCRDWSALAADLAEMEGRHVSASAVIDPMAELGERQLSETFRDLVVAYKDHFVLDLGGPLEASISKHHRRKARRGAKRVEVERSDAPGEWASDWHALYAELIRHHGIDGVAAFGPESLTQQLKLPGARAYRARVEDRTVSMIVWYLRGEGASYHLGATNPEGYSASASYALFARSFEDLADEGAAWAHLGAGAGVQNDTTSGLTAFKSGWSTHSLTAHFCGRILDHERYARWCRDSGATEGRGYFPAYRFPD